MFKGKYTTQKNQIGKGSNSLLDQQKRGSPVQEYKFAGQKSPDSSQQVFQRCSDIERKIKEQRKMDIVNKINELNMKLSPAKETPSQTQINKYKSDYLNKGDYKSSFQNKTTTDYSKFEFLNKYKDHKQEPTRSEYSKQLDYNKEIQNRMDNQYKDYSNIIDESRKLDYSSKYFDSIKKYDITSKYEDRKTSNYDTSKNNILSKYQTRDTYKSPSYVGAYSDRKRDRDELSKESSAYKGSNTEYESRITHKGYDNIDQPEKLQQKFDDQNDEQDFIEYDNGLVDFRKKLKIQEMEVENKNLESQIRNNGVKDNHKVNRLRDDIQATQKDVEKQKEKMQEVYDKEKEKFEQASKEILDLYSEEKTKNEKLEEQLNSFQQVFDKQKNAMLESINELKSSYEEKLKQFELLTMESNEKLLLLEKKANENNILKTFLENPEYLNKLQKKPKKQTANQMMAEKLRALSKIGDQKRQIITELTNRNKLKDQEMAKMAEVIENCKELMRNMTDDKDYQIEQNKRMTEELQQFKELFSKRLAEMSENEMKMQDGEEGEQEYMEGDEQDHQEYAENEEEN